MTVWETMLGRRSGGKLLIHAFREAGIRSDAEALAADLVKIMLEHGFLQTTADRMLLQDLEDALMSGWMSETWSLSTRERTYAAISPAHALQRLVLDLLMIRPSRIRPLMRIPCPYLGKNLMEAGPDGLACPEEGCRIDRHAAPGDVFAYAEWLCRACGLHATLSADSRKQGMAGDSAPMAEQLFMPGMETVPGTQQTECRPSEDSSSEVKAVLTHAVQLGMPVFQNAAGGMNWVEVPIEARDTEETDAVTAAELAGILLDSGEETGRNDSGSPEDPLQLSLFDLI